MWAESKESMDPIEYHPIFVVWWTAECRNQGLKTENNINQQYKDKINEISSVKFKG